MTIKLLAKICSVAVLVLLVIAALGPAKWQPRSELGWEIDHFLGYFAITSLVCFAWPRPFVVGGALMAGGALLEGLQAFTPDRTANLLAAFAEQPIAYLGRSPGLFFAVCLCAAQVLVCRLPQISEAGGWKPADPIDLVGVRLALATPITFLSCGHAKPTAVAYAVVRPH